MKPWGSLATILKLKITVGELLGSIMQFKNSMEYYIANNYKYYEAKWKILWDLQSL